MRRRTYLKVVGTGGITALAGCSGGGDGSGDGGDGGDGGNGGDGGSGTTTGTAGDNSSPIVLGAIEPQGFAPFKPWAEAHIRGLEIGVQDLNAGGTLDREVQLEIVDSEADPGKADNGFRRLVERENAVAITGAVSSDVGIRTAGTAEELEVPNLLHMAGSSKILSRDSRYTFRVGWLPSTSHARADADYIEQNGISSVGAVVADYAWGRSVQEALNEFVPSSVETHIEVAPLQTNDFTPFLRRIPDDVELLDFVGHPSGSITAVQNVFDLGMEQTILGVDPPQGALINILGANVTNDIITRHLAVPHTEEYDELGQKVADQYDRPMYAYEPIAYLTAQMFGEAVAEAGADPSGIADHIRTGSFDMFYGNPLEYTEWGEFKDPVMQFSRFAEGSPSFYPDANYDLEVVAETSTLPAPEPQG